jgi:hypothetical protein
MSVCCLVPFPSLLFTCPDFLPTRRSGESTVTLDLPIYALSAVIPSELFLSLNFNMKKETAQGNFL